MAFNTPAHYNAAMKPLSDNSSSAYSFQLKEIPNPNSKRIGTGSEVPWCMMRSGIEEAKGAQDTSLLQRQMESHIRPDGKGKYSLDTFGKLVGCRTKDQWEERIHYLGRDVLLPHRSAPIRREECLLPRLWWQDHRRQFLFPHYKKNLHFSPATWSDDWSKWMGESIWGRRRSEERKN